MEIDKKDFLKDGRQQVYRRKKEDIIFWHVIGYGKSSSSDNVDDIEKIIACLHVYVIIKFIYRSSC